MTSELSVERNDDPASRRWNRKLLASLNWIVRPGFDLDAGVVQGFAGRSRQVLASITHRWAT